MAGIISDMMMKNLERTGGADDIYNAMDSDDFAVVVRAATGALIKILSIPLRVTFENKSKEQSNQLRQRGNQHYKKGEYELTLACYNKALATAPKGSLELTQAYSNISAVLLTLKAYLPCKLNIQACLALDCPQFLKERLDKRMEDASKDVPDEIIRHVIMQRERSLSKYFEFDVKRNAEIPCASEDVTVVVIDGRKKVVAARDIPSGTIVALERAFVSVSVINTELSCCYYCHKISFFHIPCEGCYALFCSKECMKRCMEEYHRIECQIKPYMGTLYDDPVNQLMVKAAIKISLKLSWEELSVISKQLCTERWQKSSVKETFDGNVPTSILYNDEQREVFPGRIFNGSILCACVVHCLARVPGYLPEEKKKLRNAMDALSRIMLHLYTKFTNKLELLCSAFDYRSNNFMKDFQRNLGWFSFASKLPHSCEPNLFVLGLNDQVALIALQRIKKGDELTISYITHYYETNLSTDTDGERKSRKAYIMGGIRLQCECRVCEQNWDSDSQVEATNLTRRQKDAIEKVKAAEVTANPVVLLKFACAALDELTGLTNTTQQALAFRKLTDVLHLYKYLKTPNTGYHGHITWDRY